MAIEIIDTLSQKNNGLFPLVDSNDIRGGFYQVETISERDLIPSVRRKEGMLCAVKNRLYQLVGGIDNECWIDFNAGSEGSFSGDYNDLINKPEIPVVDVNKDYVDNELDKKSDKEHEHDGLYARKETIYTIDEIDTKFSDVLNKKIDNVILDDDNTLNFYANNTIIKSIKIESNGSQVDFPEIENIQNTKIDDVIVDTQDGVTYIKLFANKILIKTIEIKTNGDNLIHVGTDEPTTDNCEVWIDVSDDEEFSSKIEDSLVTEIRVIINNLQDEIKSLKQKVIEHEGRIAYLEVNGGGSSGGTGGSGEGNKDTVYVPLTLETGELLTLEDGTILTLEDLNN